MSIPQVRSAEPPTNGEEVPSCFELRQLIEPVAQQLLRERRVPPDRVREFRGKLVAVLNHLVRARAPECLQGPNIHEPLSKLAVALFREELIAAYRACLKTVPTIPKESVN